MSDLGDICIIGEYIPAGSSVLRINGKLYLSGHKAGEYVGESVETLREGFRALVRGGEVREDDA